MYNSNYSVGGNFDEYNDKSLGKIKVKKSLNLKTKLIIIGIIFILLIIILIIFNSIKAYRNSYDYFENLMINKAITYVKKNNLSISNEIFLTLDDLEIKAKDNCNLFSGVLVNNGNYKALLMCNDYVSDVVSNDTTKVSLKGDEVILLAKGIPYIEPGVNSSKYNINGNVGTEEGVYNLNYIAIENNNILGTLTRKIIIVDDYRVKSLFPSITLKGEKVLYLEKGQPYVEQGVIAIDNIDQNITDKVTQTGNVNVNQEGEYDITYTIKNSRGYTNHVTRKVVVVNSFSTTYITALLSPSNQTNQDVSINLNIVGNNFDYIILPDQTKSSSKTPSYQVSENGIYSFVSYDKDGKSITKIVVVKNIDKTPPTGTCYAEVWPSYANISFTNTSTKQISGYNYIVNGKSTGYLKTSTYIFNDKNITSVEVNVKDSINNIGNIKCTVKQMDPTIGNNNVKYYQAFGSEYVVANTKNDIDTFVKKVRNKISQSADTANCGSACLSFALYHGQYLQYDNLDKMNLYDACHYNYRIRYNTIYSTNKQEILNLVYNEIINGRIIILQVNGTSARNSRHFVTVVGYRRNVYSASELKEEDLLIIDAWGGNLRTMDPKLDGNYRSMFNHKSKGGYRVDKIKPEYYGYAS